MSWKIVLAFFAGVAAIPTTVVALLTIDDIQRERAAKRWWNENRSDGSCPLPACGGRQMCNRFDESTGQRTPACDVLVSIRDGIYEEVYGDE